MEPREGSSRRPREEDVIDDRHEGADSVQPAPGRRRLKGHDARPELAIRVRGRERRGDRFAVVGSPVSSFHF